jgi:hypothetical protein
LFGYMQAVSTRIGFKARCCRQLLGTKGQQATNMHAVVLVTRLHAKVTTDAACQAYNRCNQLVRHVSACCQVLVPNAFGQHMLALNASREVLVSSEEAQLTSHFARTKVSSQSLAAADTDRVGMLASTAAAPGRVLSQSYLRTQGTHSDAWV